MSDKYNFPMKIVLFEKAWNSLFLKHYRIPIKITILSTYYKLDIVSGLRIMNISNFIEYAMYIDIFF